MAWTLRHRHSWSNARPARTNAAFQAQSEISPPRSPRRNRPAHALSLLAKPSRVPFLCRERKSHSKLDHEPWLINTGMFGAVKICSGFICPWISWGESDAPPHIQDDHRKLGGDGGGGGDNLLF